MKIPIETKRFVIRRFEESDLKGFLSFMLNEGSTKYLMFEAEQKTEIGARALFDYVRDAYDSNEPVHSYAVAEKGTNRYVGSCGYAPYDDGIVECYYSINNDDVGKGIATEVTSALARLLSTEVEVRAYCHPENYAAHAVAEKSGFEPKGIQNHKNFGNSGRLFVYERSS
ncbi:GNAT family N-acetyltransferase [Marinobacter salinus]|uniref:GNAT family N-acetyltransferase n=1 Tax=Marinobacter salinus TaxID=1874317 RepID=A0A1D9GJK4_9GAMM|nr:GNAT family protein [Marinobacter salinus]AOY87714.1 GNAT family N-acetyltransferase [Marinobacter salinus]